MASVGTVLGMGWPAHLVYVSMAFTQRTCSFLVHVVQPYFADSPFLSPCSGAVASQGAITPMKGAHFCHIASTMCYPSPNPGLMGAQWHLHGRIQRSQWSASICSCFQIFQLFQMQSSTKYLYQVLFCSPKT